MGIIDEVRENALERKKTREWSKEEEKAYYDACYSIRLTDNYDFVSKTWLREMDRKYPNLNSFYD